MAQLSYHTAGESHGPALTVLIEGLPAGIPLSAQPIDAELRRRQGGYGRGPRMELERDAVTILAGVRQGLTIGSPIVLQIANADSRLEEAPPLHRPRPGHADLPGSLKWLRTDCRPTAERASARETAARVAAGATAKELLRQFGIESVGFVVAVGPVCAAIPQQLDPAELRKARDANALYTPDAAAADRMRAAIDAAAAAGDTLGGVVEVRVFGVPPGLGSCSTWQQRLDGRLMGAVGAIPAIKGVEIGIGFDAARRPGSEVHDAIRFDPAQRSSPHFGFVRETNRAGGLEGGITNGQPLVVRAAMKPISTLRRGLPSVNLTTLAPEQSDYERADVCAVPAASVVVENVVAFEVARAWLEKFAGDTLAEVRAAYAHYRAAVCGLGDRPAGARPS